MQRSNEILDELRQLSMVVAGVSRQSPFEAPDNYFSEFPESMLSRLQGAAIAEAPSPDWGKAPAMSVPAGYFEGFAARMLDKVRALEGEEQSSLLSQIGKKMPYQAPEGYFDTSIPSTVLMGLNDKPTYEVPEGYFETLATVMVAKVSLTEDKKGKVISMGGSGRTWWRYAAAAVVAGLILTIGELRLRTNSGKQVLASADVSQGLAKISDQDIQSYVDDHTVQLQQVQQEEDYANSTASLDISDTDVKSFLGDVPDGELTQYMEEHGDLKDYPTN